MMKSTKKGSITVEAAIILPLFIIAVLTISYTVKLIEAEENVINGVADEARYIAAYAYIERTGIGVKSRIEKRVREDKAAEAFSVKRLGYLYSDFHNTGLISIDAAYTVRNRMLHLFPNIVLWNMLKQLLPKRQLIFLLKILSETQKPSVLFAAHSVFIYP